MPPYEERMNFMLINLDLYTFAFGAANLIILYIVLRKFLFKKVTDFMENRTNSIKAAIEKAENDSMEAAELKSKYETQIKDVRIQAGQIIDDARAKASREYDDVLKKAKNDSSKLIEKTLEEMEIEKQQMLKDVKNQVANLALSIASKVIEENMDSDKNRVLVNKLIDKEGAA